MKREDRIANEALVQLRAIISAKFSFGPMQNWTHHLFEELSEQIAKETGIVLSANTLKRFSGKVKSDSAPSKTTLNALAKFCGFESYYAFVQEGLEGKKPLQPEENRPDEAPQSLPSASRQTLFKIVGGIALLCVLCIPLYYFTINWMRGRVLEQVSFSQAQAVGQVPFTQIFKYHVPPTLTDSIFFEEFDKGEIGLSTGDSIFSYMHFVPGFRHVTFRGADQLLWESTYQVNSDGWLLVFPHGGLEPRKYVPLGRGEDFLMLQDAQMATHQIDLAEDGGWVNYFNMQDYGAEGSDFLFEVVFKNPLKNGAQQCQDAIITVECQHYPFSVHFTQQGCQKFAAVQLGETLLDGMKNDWTALTLDMNAWNRVVFHSANGIFTVEGNGEKLLETPFEGKPGKVSGLHFSFRGIGMVRYLAMKDGQGNTVCEEYHGG